MMKKAQGLSINVIIIAVIALIVLVVLAVILTGRIGIFSAGVDSCMYKGGRCQISCDAYTTPLYGTDCEKNGNICCLPIS